MASDTNPDEAGLTNDPGDDTARRYRYQWIYSAIICCQLLDETREVAEIFCEQLEDVLVKHSDDRFTGIQIKTRSPGQEVWKVSDGSVKNAFKRFTDLDSRYPDKFKAFSFVTNYPFHPAQSSTGIKYVLEKIKEANSLDDLPSRIASYVKGIAKNESFDAGAVINALSKTSASDELPQFSDVESRLTRTLISFWDRAKDCPYPAVQRAACALIEKCECASSLDHEKVLPGYIDVLEDAEDIELKARLDGKRINKTTLLSVLEEGFNETAQLINDPSSCSRPGGGETPLLLQKLDAGGFSAVSRYSAEDLRNKADYLGLTWIKKHGEKNGLQRHEHIRSLVLADAARSYEATKNEEAFFGLEMLEVLRSRFHQRRDENAVLYDCSDEHLEGFTYSLTAECKVEWSTDRPWEDEK